MPVLQTWVRWAIGGATSGFGFYHVGHGDWSRGLPLLILALCFANPMNGFAYLGLSAFADAALMIIFSPKPELVRVTMSSIFFIIFISVWAKEKFFDGRSS
jgi:hypothetical protein